MRQPASRYPTTARVELPSDVLARHALLPLRASLRCYTPHLLECRPQLRVDAHVYAVHDGKVLVVAVRLLLGADGLDALQARVVRAHLLGALVRQALLLEVQFDVYRIGRHGGAVEKAGGLLKCGLIKESCAVGCAKTVAVRQWRCPVCGPPHRLLTGRKAEKKWGRRARKRGWSTSGGVSRLEQSHTQRANPPIRAPSPEQCVQNRPALHISFRRGQQRRRRQCRAVRQHSILSPSSRCDIHPFLDTDRFATSALAWAKQLARRSSWHFVSCSGELSCPQ